MKLLRRSFGRSSGVTETKPVRLLYVLIGGRLLFILFSVIGSAGSALEAKLQARP